MVVSSTAVNKPDGAPVVVAVVVVEVVAGYCSTVHKPHGAPVVVVVVVVVAQYTSHMGHHPRRDGQGQVPGAGTRAT